MAQQTLNRKVENDNPTNSNSDKSDDDFTWGGKKPRFIYNYTLEPFVNTSNSDSNETDSVYSYQSKTTMEAMDEEDISSNNCSGSDCDCQNSRSDIEYDVINSSSSSCHKIDKSDSSDSSTVVDFVVTKDIITHDETYDKGYVPDDTDNHQVSIQKRKIPPPACFKTCVQCKKVNPNPFYQYCHSCFQYRMEFFENKPYPKPKSIKRLKESNKKNNDNERNIQNSGIENSQELLNVQSQKEDIKNKVELCNICFLNTKNGVFNHGKIGHIYCCYSCAKHVWTTSNKCPMCNVKIKFVTKMIRA